jgi:hypothetical protein
MGDDRHAETIRLLVGRLNVALAEAEEAGLVVRPQINTEKSEDGESREVVEVGVYRRLL